MGKAASLNPSDYQSGGAVQDGRYIIVAARAQMFDYGGKAAAVPAVAMTFRSSDGTEVEQNYSVGKPEHLEPSADGSEFVHPGGEDAKINKSSNYAWFVSALVAAGFPADKLTSKVTCVVGADIDIENKAQPVRPGLTNQKEGKTLPVPVKFHGQGKVTTHTMAKGTTAPAAAPNGDLNAAAKARVLTALATAQDGTMSRPKLATAVWLTAQKEKDASALGYKKLVGDISWLNEHAGEQWICDGDNITLIPA